MEARSEPPHRVLLVDDHPVVRAGYRRLIELESDFVVVGECGDVDSALEALEAIEPVSPGRPNLLVVDLAMPRRSGLELVKEVRQRYRDMRTLVFSMHDNTAIVSEALRCGASGYVTKASAPEELIDALRRVSRQNMPVLSSDLASRHFLKPVEQEQPLSLKEIEVLRRLAAGDSLATIASSLQISPKTVSNYQTSLKTKLNVSTPVELMRYARDHGYVV